VLPLHAAVTVIDRFSPTFIVVLFLAISTQPPSCGSCHSRATWTDTFPARPEHAAVFLPITSNPSDTGFAPRPRQVAAAAGSASATKPARKTPAAVRSGAVRFLICTSSLTP
jgi:hypothetical protein